MEGHTGHTSDDTQGIAVELLLVGLDEVSQVAGVSADTATICRRLIAKFATSCGDHIVTVLGASFPRLRIQRQLLTFRSNNIACLLEG